MISVVIPTRNRADLLAPALESIRRQSLVPSEFEVLVIDNGSTDHTQKVIEHYKSHLVNLRGIFAPEPGLHTGRHAGMNAATGDVLVFADDDIEATPTWLETYRQLFSDPNVAMAGGNNFPLFIQPPPEWLKKLWEQPRRGGALLLSALSILDLSHSSRPFSPYLVWGCNFAIRKSVLFEAGGFHPDGMPKELIRFRGDGETHVSKHIENSGLRCLFHPDASVYHKVTPERMTLQYFRQRGFNQGISDSYTALRSQDTHIASTRRNWLYASASWAWRKFKDHVYLTREARQALFELELGHSEGYAYHQAAYHDDPEVHEWVHRPTYF